MKEAGPRRCFIYILALWDLFSQSRGGRQSHVPNRIMGAASTFLGKLIFALTSLSLVQSNPYLPPHSAGGTQNLCRACVILLACVNNSLCVFSSQGGRAAHQDIGLGWNGAGGAIKLSGSVPLNLR